MSGDGRSDACLPDGRCAFPVVEDRGGRTVRKLRVRVLRSARLLLLVALLSSACAGATLPPDASVHGHLTDALLKEATWMSAGLAVVATVWLLVALVLGLRKRPVDTARADSPLSRAAVLGLALGAFLLLDGHLWLGNTRVIGVLKLALAELGASPDAVRIEVNAQRWAFLFRHPGTDGRFNTDDDVVTTNTLRVPAGRPLLLQLAASDVVHGLHIPALRIQAEAIPGRITKLWAVPTGEGVHDFQCSQHCGTAHYRMRGQLEVLPPARYDAWLAAESARAASRVDPEDPQRNWGWEWRP